ncbi:PorT family protein [Chitinophagaceae bacterium LB-8]|uniref:PorT family protein n=1 Tax=Paraflavisolibacter caeni TaxID=2982496 RepID=A0A9X2XWR8_9BACT|nr:outer membrane beta-barrel protein [Paraflavisolibacter caeni]MCU7550661.1 PorT family protein [Paraflavisolibacter caeni]
MRRIVFTGFILIAALHVFAQKDSTVHPKPAVTLPRSNDHLILQFGYTAWNGTPDTINTSGFHRAFNAYFMFDFPFKSNPHFSAAIGAGVSTENVYFDKTIVDIKSTSSSLQFRDASDTNHFKKFKIATTFLEAPVELRYNANPENNNKSFKIAVGAKIGTLLNAHTKGKELQNKGGGTVNDYITKENTKRFFNQNRISLTGRIGYGNLSIFGSYAVTPLFKEGLAPTIRPFTFGIMLSGL